MSTAGHATTLRYSEKLVWFSVLVGIPAWIAHLVFEAAMIRFTDTHHGWEWTLHAATALTALVTLAGIAVCLDLFRRAQHARRAASSTDAAIDDDASAVSLSRFLGALGVLVGVSNLALILAEGSYVIFVRRGG